GGNFTQVNVGAEIAANRIVRWDGSQWSKVGSGTGNGVDADVVSLAVHDGSLYVGGGFTATNFLGTSVPAQGVARWDGVAWSPLGSGISGRAMGLLVADDGSLYAG